MRQLLLTKDDLDLEDNDIEYEQAKVCYAQSSKFQVSLTFHPQKVDLLYDISILDQIEINIDHNISEPRFRKKYLKKKN